MTLAQVISSIENGGDFEGLLQIIDFGTCLYFVEGEVTKIFSPKLKKRFGDRLIEGDFGFFLTKEVKNFRENLKFRRPASLSVCHTANFPDLILRSKIHDTKVSNDYISTLLSHLRALPSNDTLIRKAFGEDFFRKNVLGRAPVMVNFLKAHLT